jgi:hypothetical protein
MKRITLKTICLLTASVFALLLPLCVSISLADEDFHIISARYGVPGNYWDVTQTLKGFVSDHAISMQVTNQNLDADPAPGKEKEMVVVYQSHDAKVELHVPEGGWFVVPSPKAGYQPPHHGPGKLEIIRALYGAEGKYRIVTGDVQNHVQNNNINMLVSNENLGGDPSPNHEKEFVVIYQKQGREYGTHLHEGSWFIVTD